MIGGNIIAAFDRLSKLITAVTTIVEGLGHTYQYNDNLGYITTCPSELGTAFKVSVLVSNHSHFFIDCSFVYRLCDYSFQLIFFIY